MSTAVHSTGSWVGGLAEWIEGDTAYLSVGFTWKLNDAYQRAVFYKAQGYRVRAGGPGIFTRKHFLADVAEIGGTLPEGEAIVRHNPVATMASRGCSVGCWFCIVPKMEGRTFTELPDFPVRPVLCDNKLSALSPAYHRGYRDGLRAAVTWLADRASTMADPHATAVLNSAAFSLGVDAKQGKVPSKARTRPTAPATEQEEG